MVADHLLLLVFTALMLSGAWLDLTKRKLPNLLCLLVFVTGVGATTWNQGLNVLPSAAIHLFLALLVGIALFKFGMIGGGDAKFYAASAIWFPLSQALALLLSISIFGILLLLAWFTVRLTTRSRGGSKRSKGHDGVPYGVAIALGALVLLFVSS